MISHLDLLTRIGVATLLGGVIGYERDVHGRPVGLRTHLLVAMASATFMVVSTHFVYLQGYAEGEFVEVDGSRIAASVVSGIGFLAGGAILRQGASVQGLTTAAALWLVTAIGLCAGAGMYIESTAVTLAGVIALTVLRRFEDKSNNVIKRRVLLVFDQPPESVPALIAVMTGIGVRVFDYEYDRRVQQQKVALNFDVRVPEQVGVARLIEELEKQPKVRRIQVRAPS